MSRAQLPSAYHGWGGRPELPRDGHHTPEPHPSRPGRIDRSWSLLDQSWRFLRARPALLVLPAISVAATTLAVAAVSVPALVLTDAGVATLVVAVGVASLLCGFISAFCNVGFLSMVLAHHRGERPTWRDGLRASAARWRVIAAWSVLSTIVAGAFGALRAVPGGDWLGNLAGFLGGLAWGVATLFVVPLLALEGRGPITTVRRSATTFRKTWGEAVVAEVAIGFLLWIAIVPGAITIAIGVAAWGGAPLLAGILLALGAALVVPPLVLSSSLRELFLLELYRLAADGRADGVFTEAQLRAELKPRRRGLLRR
jgi:hypothetical protein